MAEDLFKKIETRSFLVHLLSSLFPPSLSFSFVSHEKAPTESSQGVVRLILREKIELVSITVLVLSIEVDLIHQVEDSAETLIDGRGWPMIVVGRSFPVSATPNESVYPRHLHLHQLCQSRFARRVHSCVLAASVPPPRHVERICTRLLPFSIPALDVELLLGRDQR